MKFPGRRRPGVAQRNGYRIGSRNAERASHCMMPRPRGAKARGRPHSTSAPNVGLPLSLPPTRARECLEGLLEMGGMAERARKHHRAASTHQVALIQPLHAAQVLTQWLVKR